MVVAFPMNMLNFVSSNSALFNDFAHSCISLLPSAMAKSNLFDLVNFTTPPTVCSMRFVINGNHMSARTLLSQSEKLLSGEPGAIHSTDLIHTLHVMHVGKTWPDKARESMTLLSTTVEPC